MQFSKTTSYFKKPTSISLDFKNNSHAPKLEKFQRRTSLNNRVKSPQIQTFFFPSEHKKLQLISELNNPQNKVYRKSQSSFSIQSNKSFNEISSKSKQLTKNNFLNKLKEVDDKRYKNYQDQASKNIYFNQVSRTNYFKNLIDTYFQHDKNKQQVKQKKNNEKILKRRSNFTMRQSEPQKQLSAPPLLMMNQVLTLKKHQSESNNKNNSKNMNNKNVIPFLAQSQQIMLFANVPLSQQIINNATFIDSSYLPKITQNADDLDQDMLLSYSISQPFFNQTSLKRSSSSLQRKIVSFQNKVIKIYLLQQNGKKYRIKEFKNILFLQREQKAALNGVHSIWKASKFSPNSLFSPLMLPIKDQLFKIQPHPLFSDLIFIKSYSFYQKIIKDKCHQAIHFLINLIKDMKKISGKILNNKINISNIFYFKGKFILGQWEYSAFKDQDVIQNNKFQSRIQPILKCQSQWLVSPQYLAPQIVQSMISDSKPFDLWKYQSAPDIWSIGLTFIQMITLIPMWMPKKAIIRGKKMKPRMGFLCTQNRSLQRILEKQICLQQKVKKILNIQLNQTQQNEQFFSILLRMIQPNPSKRITYDQILQKLTKKNFF